MVKSKFGPTVESTKSKLRRGQIVSVDTGYPIYACTEAGETMRDDGGFLKRGPSVTTFAWVVGPGPSMRDPTMFLGDVGPAVVVRIIPAHEVNKHPVASGYFGMYCLALERKLTHGTKEKRMTEAKIYDGETFFVERVKSMNEIIHKDELDEKSKSSNHLLEDR